MSHTTIGKIIAISMVAALAVVGVSMLSSTKAQAISFGNLRLDSKGVSIGGERGLNLDFSSGRASIGGENGLNVDPSSGRANVDGLDTAKLFPTPEK